MPVTDIGWAYPEAACDDLRCAAVAQAALHPGACAACTEGNRLLSTWDPYACDEPLAILRFEVGDVAATLMVVYDKTGRTVLQEN